MLRIIPVHSGNRRGPLDSPRRDIVVRIALVKRRGVIYQNGVDLEHPEQEHQPRAHLDDGPGVHVVVRVLQEERVLAAHAF